MAPFANWLPSYQPEIEYTAMLPATATWMHSRVLRDRRDHHVLPSLIAATAVGEGAGHG